MAVSDDPAVFCPRLTDRARFALLDRDAWDWNELGGMATSVSRRILGQAPDEITRVVRSDRSAEFTIDGLKFKACIGTVKEPGSGNERYEGIRESEVEKLFFYYRSAWFPIGELADLGKLLAQDEAVSA